MSNLERYYVLFLMLLSGATSHLDRQVLTILIEPIRHDLALSDSQIGLVTGIAFTAAYVLFTIPAARLADAWSRRKVIALAISVWSVATIFSGVAQNFIQLFLARVGVGVGEGAGHAPGHAVVGDLFQREERATALSILFMYVPLGTALGLLWGGWAAGEFGWRVAIMLAGVPGLILAPLILFTVREVHKGLADGVRQPVPQLPFRAVLHLLWSIRSLRNMVFATACSTFLTMGVMAWVPSFLVRSHALSPGTIGLNMAVATLIGYTFGSLCGGRLLDVLGRRDLRWHFWVPVTTTLIAGGFSAAFFQAPVAYIFTLLGAQLFFSSLFSAGLIAITQNLVPVAVRATASGCLLFVTYSLGVGIGPQAIGLASDLLRPMFGEESLRIALFGATSLAIPASLFHFRASLSYRSDIAAADARNRVGWDPATGEAITRSNGRVAQARRSG